MAVHDKHKKPLGTTCYDRVEGAADPPGLGGHSRAAWHRGHLSSCRRYKHTCETSARRTCARGRHLSTSRNIDVDTPLRSSHTQ